MKNKNEIKKFAKLLNEFMDNEIKMSKTIYEADENNENEDPGLRARKNQFQSMFGKEVKTDPGMIKSPISTGEYAKVDIPPQFDMFAKEAKGYQIINHAILARSIDRSFFGKDLKPRPMLIWGAPGIGKSAGVRQGAINIAKRLAKQKGLVFVENVTSIKDAYSNTEEFNNSFYFIDWGATSDKEKEMIMVGPSTQEPDLVNKGETITVNQYALRVPAKNLFIFFDERVAGIADTDILGIPFRADARVRYEIGKVEEPRIIMQRLPFLKVCCDEKELNGVIMWDELNQGSPQTQAALYSVILDRKVGGDTLAPGIGQFAAANGKLWNTAPLMPALAARFKSSYLWVSPEDWLLHHKKELPPVVYDFIADNPKVSFYITEEGWKKEYEPRVGAEGQTKEEFVTSGVKWPNPRDLSMFGKEANELIGRAVDEGWDQEKLKSEMVELAERSVGPVWADHFSKYMYEQSAVKWETLVTQPNMIKDLVSGTKDVEPVRNLMQKHLRKAFDLSKTVHTKSKYEKEALDVMTVFVYAADVNLDSVATVLQRVRDEINTEKTGETPEQVGQRISKVINDGRTSLPDRLKSGADKVMMALKKMLAETPVLDKKAPQKLATNTITQTPSAAPAPTPVPSAENSIPEKYTAFNKIFEEISSSIKPSVVPSVTSEAPDMLAQKQQKSTQNIAVKINDFINRMDSSLPEDKKDKMVLDAINHEIMADTILTKEQKQKLISVIKGAPTSINAMHIISAYTTTGVFRL